MLAPLRCRNEATLAMMPGWSAHDITILAISGPACGPSRAVLGISLTIVTALATVRTNAPGSPATSRNSAQGPRYSQPGSLTDLARTWLFWKQRHDGYLRVVRLGRLRWSARRRPALSRTA